MNFDTTNGQPFPRITNVLITSPSGKQYVGQSKVPVAKKIKSYIQLEKYIKSDRLIANAIKKYGWNNMKFEVIDQSQDWLHVVKE